MQKSTAVISKQDFHIKKRGYNRRAFFVFKAFAWSEAFGLRQMKFLVFNERQKV